MCHTGDLVTGQGGPGLGPQVEWGRGCWEGWERFGALTYESKYDAKADSLSIVVPEKYS